MLPDRNDRAEDAYVGSWASVDDDEALMEAISAAMEARRPLLAARLVGLLDDRVEIPPGSDLERAQRAASLLLVNRDDAARNDLENEMIDAWRSARRRRMRRIKARMRMSGTSRHESVPRVGRRPRKRG